VQLTHDFPEWEKYYTEGTSTRIPLQEILHAQGAKEMEQIMNEQIKLQIHQRMLQKAINAPR